MGPGTSRSRSYCFRMGRSTGRYSYSIRLGRTASGRTKQWWMGCWRQYSSTSCSTDIYMGPTRQAAHGANSPLQQPPVNLPSLHKVPLRLLQLGAVMPPAVAVPVVAHGDKRLQHRLQTDGLTPLLKHKHLLRQRPPQPPSVRPEVTDKVQGGGLLTGIDDKAIDRIFGEIGVQESVSKTLVNSGAEPVSNFSPPQTPAPQQMAAPMPAPAPAMAAPAPSPEVPKGLLGGIDDNAIDRIFSQNLGVSEPSVPVGRSSEMSVPAAGGSWSQPQQAPAAAPVESAPTATGWGAPPAASGWGQPPAVPVAASVAESAPAAGANTGWGMAPAAPSQWGQPPAEPAPMAAAPAVESGPPKLFSVDDSVMDRIFADNLGIPKDGQPAANAGVVQSPPAAPVFQDPQHRPSLAEAPVVEANYQAVLLQKLKASADWMPAPSKIKTPAPAV